MRLSSFRTPTEKADLEISWHRPDDEFFGTGGCHVLAHVFLAMNPSAGYRPLLIAPTPGHRGMHVVCASDRHVFDFNGYTDLAFYFEELQRLHRERDAAWSADVFELDLDPAGWDFCRKYGHRHPSQFFGDPIPRARAFVGKFRLGFERHVPKS